MHIFIFGRGYLFRAVLRLAIELLLFQKARNYLQIFIHIFISGRGYLLKFQEVAIPERLLVMYPRFDCERLRANYRQISMNLFWRCLRAGMMVGVRMR